MADWGEFMYIHVNILVCICVHVYLSHDENKPQVGHLYCSVLSDNSSLAIISGPGWQYIRMSRYKTVATVTMAVNE